MELWYCATPMPMRRIRPISGVSGNVIINSTTGIYLEKDSLDSDVAITGNVSTAMITDIKSNSAADITLSGNCYGSGGAGRTGAGWGQGGCRR